MAVLDTLPFSNESKSKDNSFSNKDLVLFPSIFRDTHPPLWSVIEAKFSNLDKILLNLLLPKTR